jgi:curli biogenesis system outer membrane secretion channel CsgG
MRHPRIHICFALIISCIAAGCGGGGGQTTAQQIGVYSSSPPPMISKPRLGITALAADDEASATTSSASLGEASADAFGELLEKTRRFTVIKCDEFTAQLSRQGLGDIVRPGQLVRTGPVKEVDYVLVGSVSNLSITKTAEAAGMVDRVKDFVTRAPDRSQVMITATCGIGLNIIDPATGDIIVSNNSEFSRTAGASELGIDVLQGNDAVQAGQQMPVTREDRERVVKLALDDAIRKSLPKIDRFLTTRHATRSTPLVTQTPTTAPTVLTTAPAAPPPAERPPVVAPATPASGKVICPVCGAENDASAKFCKRCAAKLK